MLSQGKYVKMVLTVIFGLLKNIHIFSYYADHRALFRVKGCKYTHTGSKIGLGGTFIAILLTNFLQIQCWG
jgi:hypothetical protein